jgi:deoxycytidylate deaminase
MTNIERLLAEGPRAGFVPEERARLTEKLKTFYRFAHNLAELSTCKRLSVGCVIVTPSLGEVVGIGYNGPPRGTRNDQCRSGEGTCGCIHAEANALVKARAGDNLILFTTFSPCEHCAGLIVNSQKVKYLVFGLPYRDPVNGMKVLTQAGVIVRQLRDMTEKGTGPGDGA